MARDCAGRQEWQAARVLLRKAGNWPILARVQGVAEGSHSAQLIPHPSFTQTLNHSQTTFTMALKRINSASALLPRLHSGLEGASRSTRFPLGPGCRHE